MILEINANWRDNLRDPIYEFRCGVGYQASILIHAIKLMT